MKKALIVVDVQRDFCEGGSLEVKRADQDYLALVQNLVNQKWDYTVFTHDWHPAGHKSFASYHGAAPFSATELNGIPQVLWPDHCVQNTPGAELMIEPAGNVLHVYKGTNPEVDSYSAFMENDKKTYTELCSTLVRLGVQELVVVGLALDYCVSYTCLDAVELGFHVSVISSATRSIGDHSQALKLLQDRGVTVVE